MEGVPDWWSKEFDQSILYEELIDERKIWPWRWFQSNASFVRSFFKEKTDCFMKW